MKYAIVSDQKRIVRISEGIPATMPPFVSAVEISDADADTVSQGFAAYPRVIYFLIEGELLTLAQKVAREEELKTIGSRVQTKLQLMYRLDALGKWETFKAVIATMPAIVQDAWTLAQDIKEDDPLFSANKEALQQALGLTEEQISGLFKAN